MMALCVHPVSSVITAIWLLLPLLSDDDPAKVSRSVVSLGPLYSVFLNAD